METPRFKVLQEKPGTQERCHASYHHAHENQQHDFRRLTKELWHFQKGRRANDGCAKQKRIACRFFMAQASA